MKHWKRRLAWFAGGSFVLLVAVFFAGPPLAAPFVGAEVVAAVEKQVPGSASLESLSLSWFGNARIEGLEIRDVDGALALVCPEIDVAVSPFAALGGRLVGDVLLTGPEITVVRDANGRPQFPILERREADDAGSPPASGKPSPGSESSSNGRENSKGLPELICRVENARFIEKEQGLEETWADLSATLVPRSADQFDLTGVLGLNGGRVDFETSGDLRKSPDARSSVKLTIQDVGASSEVIELLGYVHPIFGVARGKVDGWLSGKVTGNLEMSHAGPLDLERFGDGWKSYPKDLFDGLGHLEFRDFSLEGTALLADLLEGLDVERPQGIELNPVDFHLVRGRLRYDRPMQMKIDGHKTFWVGSVGLDETLDMKWQVPITKELAERQSRLKPWVGETVEVPVGGTTRAPEVRWQGVFGDLIQRGAEGILEKGLDDLLGEGGEGQSAAELLQAADRLWSEGKKTDAATLYGRIRSEHRSSLVYKLNKKRIKDRMFP